MTPWQVIEEALARKRPARGPKWLADQLGEKIQVVSNWKARGVPAKRFREIATTLGLTINQLEGIDPPPWDREGADGLLPEVVAAAEAINALPKRDRDWVLQVIQHSLEVLQLPVDAPSLSETPSSHEAKNQRRKVA